ncbi:restriction endonuclease [Kitasatospora sp. NPDC057542]|uniref:restriction endonuclease n=1 Tax=Streptomycetaceae TaxID=2062 RepID=UPI001CCF95B7|nr:restriction endonuclease [Streptomyces sp. LS1784]
MGKRPRPGEAMSRPELHDLYGGNRQSGISISGRAGMIHLFSDPIAAEKYGLVDGFDDDGAYLYTGAGQRGDQTLTQGNKALLTHKDVGRDVYVWQRVDQTAWCCLGQFEVDQEQPYISDDAIDADGDLRTVIVFRLRPVGDPVVAPPVATTLPGMEDSIAEEIAVIRSRSLSQRVVQANRDSEAGLSRRYRAHLERLGHEVMRYQIRPPGEVRPFTTDLYDRTDNLLVECKPSPTRQAVRLAVGKLLDFRRFLSPTPRLAVLTASKPRQDLIDLCSSIMIEVIWPDGDGTFISSFD